MADSDLLHVVFSKDFIETNDSPIQITISSAATEPETIGAPGYTAIKWVPEIRHLLRINFHKDCHDLCLSLPVSRSLFLSLPLGPILEKQRILIVHRNRKERDRNRNQSTRPVERWTFVAGTIFGTRPALKRLTGRKKWQEKSLWRKSVWSERGVQRQKPENCKWLPWNKKASA